MAFFSRVPTGRVIFEIGGAPVREELARDGEVVLFSSCISAKRLCSTSPGRRQATNDRGVHRPEVTASAGESTCYPGGERKS
jgi:hypothetical protein